MFTLLALLVIGTLASAQEGKVSDAKSKKQVLRTAQAKDFSELADRFMKESLALSPVNASQAGYHKHALPGGRVIELDALLDDYSEHGFEEKRQFYRQWQTTFHGVDRNKLNPEEDADWQIIDDNISLSLLDLQRVEKYKHNPTIYVEDIGNALFLPMTQAYASKEVRLGHVLARVGEIPTAVKQAKTVLVDADPIFVSTAIEENDGNVDLIETTLKEEIPAASPLAEKYAAVAPSAIQALQDFSQWLKDDLGKRPPSRTWRLGKEFYPDKFRYVLETPVTPEQILADAERELKEVRAEMLRLAMPMHKQMYPDHSEHAELSPHDRENTIIGEVLYRISDDHPDRDKLMDAVKADLVEITQFIREKKIVALSDRENLKVIPTPVFMRGIYSVAGFHGSPPLEPTAEAQYWVTPIDPKMPAEKAESKLREYNSYTLKWLSIHEALPGHYIQAEHANNLQPETRRVLRAQFGNGPYIEGWAEYIAQVMMDEGFLNNDPRFRMVMRKLRLRLLANTILDVRMHTMNMTDQQALDLMTKECFQTQAEADGKLRRAKLESVQLPMYYVGLREWFKLRQEYQARMGDKFNMMEYHNRVLDEGALPVPVLRQIVLSQKTMASAGR
ncbi:MAG TPA: DUF885 domain-containing protein [Terriglobales bacterium]|nr:DUF885 domain-containing protein [Terriglobales bacterium]